jgi:hypothetical protein
MTKGDHKDEYREVSENIRHWQQLRFIAMTVFMAVSAGLMSASFQWKTNLTLITSISIRIMGVLSVIIFWIQDERIVQYWLHYSARAKDLEKDLKFKQYSTTPPRNRIITSGNAMRLLYIMFFVFWTATLIFHSQF